MKNIFVALTVFSSPLSFANDNGLVEWINSMVNSSDIAEAQSLPSQEEPNAQTAGCVDAEGNDIFNEPEKFQKLIAEADSCTEATELAEACMWGSGLDVATAGVAYGVCETEMNDKGAKTPSSEAALNSMTTACAEKYKNEQGSMYRSAEAYCGLSAINWVVDHLSADY